MLLETGQVLNKNKCVDYESRSEMRLWTKEKADLAIIRYHYFKRLTFLRGPFCMFRFLLKFHFMQHI